MLDFCRKYVVTDMDGQAVVGRLYICLQIHLRVYSTWLKFQLPPTIFSLSVGVIITAFVSIRYTDLQFILYCFYVNTTCNLMLIVFWVCFDAIHIVRVSEDIIGRLQSGHEGHIRSLPRAVRIQVLKRAKILKRIKFDVGDFTELTLNLPMAMWEEIMNQVLLLLSF